MRSFSSVALLFIIWLAITASCCAAETQAAPGTPLTPVSTLLKPDGSLNLSSGFSGSLDVKGYRMETGANGAPRFVPSAAPAADSPLAVQANAAPGPESNADDVYWDDQFTLSPTDGSILAAVVDGSGILYIAGSFGAVGRMSAGNIAKWDGTSWSTLGTGTDGYIRALSVSGGDLYAGGMFKTAGDVAANCIARWNGTSWAALGSGVGSGTHDAVYALAVSGTDVYAGGCFTSPSGFGYIAKWNGSSWSTLGGGMNASVLALAVSGSNVYAGGYFTIAGSVSANYIAKWDGTSWSALGSGVGGPGSTGVRALAVSGSDVYAGGYFTTAGGVSANYIAKWDGTSWSALGSGMSGPRPWVNSLEVSGSDVYVGGSFSVAGDVSANCAAKWNGTSWTALGSGMGGQSPYVEGLAVSGNGVYAIGQFTLADGASANQLAKWDGASWSTPNSDAQGRGLSDPVYALTVSGSQVYAGGDFTMAGDPESTDRTAFVANIARWDGKSWSALGSGLDSYVYALAVSGSDLYAAGGFTTAGDVSARGIAKWDGKSWSALGTGFSSGVYALAACGSNVYAGGSFTSAGGVSAKNVAKWDGTSWSALGTGLDGPIYALAVSGSTIYAGGYFTTAGRSETTSGISVKCIAKWNGTSWSTLGSGMNSLVTALAVSGSDLYVGGDFTIAGGIGANRIARWDGSTWHALSGGLNSSVLALTVSGSDVYAGGDFTFAQGPETTYGYSAVNASHIAKWNGKVWSALGNGTDDRVSALSTRGNTLLVGGTFSAAHGRISSHFAELQPRVDVSTVTVSASPGALTIGDSAYGFNRPALFMKTGTTVDYIGELPTTVTLDRADEILVDGKRVNGAFTLSPEGMQFGGDGATIRVEFSEVDVALFGCAYTDFRAVSLAYPANYPVSKEAACLTLLPGQGAPVPIRIDNGKQIYAITAPLSEVSAAYGAIPSVLVKSSDISLSGSCDPASVVFGQNLQFAFTVTNAGQNQATDVVFSDTLPVGCTYVSSSASQGTVGLESGTVVGELGSIAAGGSSTITVVLRPTAVGPFANSAVVAADQADPAPANNTTTVTAEVTPVPKPDLVVSGSGDPSAVVVGGQVSCTFTVANSGSGQATGVRLTSAVPSGCTYVSSSTTQGSAVFENGAVTAQLGSLAPGSSFTVTIVLRPDVVGTLSCSASASADQTDCRTDDNSATVTTSITPVPRPDLVVSGSGDPSAVVVGSEVSYAFSVVNSGPGQATGVRLTSAIPSGCTYVSSSTTLGSVSVAEGMVTARLAALAPGSSATVTIVLRPEVVGTLSCTASASADQADLHTGDNSATVTTSVTPPPSADLVVSGSGNPSAVVVGGQVSYAFSVVNSGPGQATQVVLTSAIPSGCTYVSSSTTQGSASVTSGTVAAHLGLLAEGSSATVTIVLRPDIAGTLSFSASASADQTDSNLANNSTTVTTAVTPAFGPDLSGSWSGVSQSTRTSRAGSVCTVKGRLTVSNRGNQDAARSVVRVYLSDTISVAPGSAPIKTINVQKLRIGKSSSNSLSVRLPAGVQVSGKYLVAILDADGVLAEMNESNNAVTWGRF